MPYQFSRRQTIFDWLENERDPDRRAAFLADLKEVAAGPLRGTLPVPGKRLVFVRALARSRLSLTFLLAEQFKTVHIISIDDL